MKSGHQSVTTKVAEAGVERELLLCGLLCGQREDYVLRPGPARRQAVPRGPSSSHWILRRFVS